MKENKTLKHLIEVLAFIPGLVWHCFRSWAYAALYVISAPFRTVLAVVLLILLALTRGHKAVQFAIDKTNDFMEFLLNGVVMGEGFNEK